MSVPVILIWESLVNAIVEVLVMREDNVSTNIVQLEKVSYVRDKGSWKAGKHTKPSGVTSVEASPPGIGFESMINHDAESWKVS